MVFGQFASLIFTVYDKRLLRIEGGKNLLGSSLHLLF